MSISWGPGWYGTTTVRGRYPEKQEQIYVEDMIANSDNAEVRRYCESRTGGQVYVKSGRHASPSEGRAHITLQLGCSQKPYTSNQWPGKTAHVMDILLPNSKFATDLFHGLTSDSKKKIAQRYG